MERLVRGKETEINKFAEEVDKGLSGKEKKISSKYLYNKEGSRLFEEIMDLPEYYPSKCELEILQTNKKKILDISKGNEELYLVDLGAGNGAKTQTLLNYFLGRINFQYIPIDISKTALEELEKKFQTRYKDLSIQSIHSEYMEALNRLKENTSVKKVILFLGSTIGNFTFREALRFLSDLNDSLNPDDLVMIGFDIKKDPDVIRNAYNDSRGITAKFNFNLLRRINEELGANFDLINFKFYPTYDPETGEVKSYLVSKNRQEVFIKYLNKKYLFEQWETIHTECSNKYDMHMIQELAERTGYIIEENLFDSKQYFLNSIWRVR